MLMFLYASLHQILLVQSMINSSFWYTKLKEKTNCSKHSEFAVVQEAWNKSFLSWWTKFYVHRYVMFMLWPASLTFLIVYCWICWCFREDFKELSLISTSQTNQSTDHMFMCLQTDMSEKLAWKLDSLLCNRRIQPTATTTSEPPPTTRRAPSPMPSTTRESFGPRTQTADRLVPHPVGLQHLPVVRCPPARCQVQGLDVTTPVPLPGCLMPPMPSLTPSPGWHRASRHLPIQLFSRLEITPETVACWTAQPSLPMTTTDTPPSIPATAWALLHP